MILGFAGLVGAGRTEIMRSIRRRSDRQRQDCKIKGKGSTYQVPASGDPSRHCAFLTEDRKGQGLVLARAIRTNPIRANMEGFLLGLFLNERRSLRAGEQNIASLRIQDPVDRRDRRPAVRW